MPSEQYTKLFVMCLTASIQAHENASSDAGSSGLVSYGSDEEDEEQAETQVDEGKLQLFSRRQDTRTCLNLVFTQACW